MKTWRSLALVLTLAGAAAAAAAPREDLDLRAFLLADMLSSYAKTGEVCYVAFARTADPKTGQVQYLDPPPEFFARFKSRFAIKKASEHPAREKADPPINPATGLPDGIYVVEIVQWLSGTTARVRTSLFRSPTWARGRELIVERETGAWEIRECTSRWTR